MMQLLTLSKDYGELEWKSDGREYTGRYNISVMQEVQRKLLL